MSANNGLTTNLNQSPYWADYDPSKQYYPVLFKPSTAVQARELNNAQLAGMHQVALFGQNIFTQGTIINGCNITYNGNLPYVKILDNYANGSAFTITDFQGLYAQSNSGLQAFVFSVQAGLSSLSPNLNTLYINYLNSATNTQIKVFQNDEILSLYTSANLLIGTVQVANTISSGTSNTTGYGYSVAVDDGAIFSKGICLDVKKQSVIVSPYTNLPNNLSVGFYAVESIVTAFQDETLLDNAQGAPAYFGPGADRLQIVPTLTVIASDSANTISTSFFSIVDFVGGAPSIVNQDTSYAALGDKLAQISDETNGSFIIRPFNVRCLQNYVSNGAIDANNMKLEVDAGLAYVNGYRIQVIGKLLNVIAKGNATNTAVAQIATMQMGNYIKLQEVAGTFIPNVLETISLRNAPAYAISNNLAKGIGSESIAAPGSQIGTASLIAMEYVSGQPSTQTAIYDAYIFNIAMTGNNSFAQTRSIYLGTTPYGFGDVILQNNTAVLSSANLASLVYPLNNQAVKTLTTAANTVDTQFQFQSETLVTFSNTGTVSVTIPTYIGGVNELPYGIGTVSPTVLENFIISIGQNQVNATNATGTVTVTGGNANIVGSATTFQTQYYVGGIFVVANSSASETKQIATITDNTHMTTTVAYTSSWTAANSYLQYQYGQIIPLAFSNAAITVSNTTNFSVALNQNFLSTFSAQILYPIERTQATGAKKQLQVNTFILLNLSNNAGGITGPWCLGIPDVYQVSNVWVGSTYTNTNPSVTSQYTLHNGQQDMFYGLSYLYSNGATANSTQVLLIEVQAFQRDLSHGDGFYSIDSYPIDDTGATPNSIFTVGIPTYISNVTGQSYNLRNSVDFRMVVANTIPYVSNLVNALLPNTAIVNPANTRNFLTSNLMIPIPDAQFETSYQYYMGRYDTIGLSNSGVIIINEGIPAQNPLPPGDISAGMTLGTIYIPPYPSLTPDVVPNGYSTYSDIPIVSITPRGNRRYTMADIGVLDARISQVEYYTSLNLLESSAQNLLLTSANGQNLFQNGMFADPMNDFSRCNTIDPAFNIAIDSISSVARPIFEQSLINLVYNASNSVNTVVSTNGREITLQNSTGGVVVSQTLASHVRNAAQDSTYTWAGAVALIPEGDYVPDVTVNPTVTVNINNYSNWVNLVNAWGTQWGAWNETSAVSSTATSSIDGGLSSTSTTTTTTTATKTGTQLAIVGSSTQTYNFGDVVTSVSLQPFCRSQLLQFHATGLKPSTQHWIFFNDVAVTSRCTQTTSSYDIINASSQTLITDAQGNLYGLFYLPGNTFYSGFLNFQVLDIINLIVDAQVITSAATCTFNGTNLAYTTEDLNLSITTPQVAQITVSQSMTTNSSVTTIYANPSVLTPQVPDSGHPGGGGGAGNGGAAGTTGGTTGGATGPGGGGGAPGPGAGDPLAQSFFINPNFVSYGIQGIFVSAIDLFFQQKDPNLGITVMIRQMDNGYPAPDIVPFSSVHLTSSQVSISTNSGTATNIQFPAPVFLEVGQSYCVVVMPDGTNPNYFLWSGVIGGTDVLTGSPIFNNSSTGVMFLSSQNSTWTPYQNEAIKFKIYYVDFTSFTGNVVFNNDDSEYLSITNTSRTFTQGEYVYYSNTIFHASNVGTVNTSTVVTTTATAGLVANTKIYIQSNTSNFTLIANVNSVTDGTHFVINVVPSFTDSNCSMGLLTANGGLTGLLKLANVTTLYVGNSTANSTTYLVNATSGIIIGGNSGASATIATLNDQKYDTLMPLFATMVPAQTSLSLSFKGSANSFNSYVADAAFQPLLFGQSVDFLDKERVVMSKSNEWNFNGGAKSLTILSQMTSLYSLISPVFDTVKSGAWRVHNLVQPEDANNDVYTSEISNLGTSNNRYISLNVALAANQAAEQLVIYLDAYLPSQTNVYVYAKIQNQYDTDNLLNKVWSPMITSNFARSSSINVQDLNEYVFTFPIADTTNAISLPINQTAYLDSSNNGCVAYITAANQVFETFNTFAIKLAFVSTAGSYSVPRVSALRAIATSV